ncbi:MAG: hypothetical protein AAB414_04185 [Patescibacteria group bacterium]
MTLKKFYIWTNILPFTLALILSLIILTLFRFLPPKLPLFYSLPWGDAQLASHTQFFIVPSLLGLITLLNLILSYNLHPAQVFLKKILVAGALISTLILAITFIKIALIFI